MLFADLSVVLFAEFVVIASEARSVSGTPRRSERYTLGVCVKRLPVAYFRYRWAFAQGTMLASLRDIPVTGG